MSVAIITTPQVSSQMTFGWDQPESQPIPKTVVLPPASTKVIPNANAQAAGRNSNTGNTFETSNWTNRNQTAIAGNHEGRLEFINHRIGKPVRIGGVMFKLLKRYGITDDEIAQGLFDYANACS